MLGIPETLELQGAQDSQGCQESLGFGDLQGQKEKRVMAALPAPACRGCRPIWLDGLGSLAPKESPAQKVWAGLANRASLASQEFKDPQD